tara:strand:+ start:5765 stop:6208 length:444 start_codon:yes stop_codon:yes gene_type:complete
MDTLDKLKSEQKDAMRAKDKVRLGTIRLALAAVKQIEVDERRALSESDLTQLLTKLVKQRRDSITQYEAAGRQELADIEANEIKILQEFLPQPLEASQVQSLIDEAIAEVEASSMQDMGKIMALLKPKIQGRADMSQVSAEIKKRLA